MKFHRFVDPTYGLSGGSFPGTVHGVAYDRINVVSGGVGAPGSAFADGAKIGGPNAGTYWHAFGEDATSHFFNRGLLALSENTDVLDDLLHRDLAAPARTSDVVSAGQTSITILGEVWLDTNPTTPVSDLFSVLDANNREILNQATGVEVVVSTVSGGTIGSGFSSPAGVTLTFNIPITSAMAPAWRVYYGERSSLATLPSDALVKIKVRSAEEVDADVERAIFGMKWDAGSANTWTTPPPINLYHTAYRGLDETYRLGTTFWPLQPGINYPVGKTLNKAGAGGWFIKTGGPGFAGFSLETVGGVTSLGVKDYALGATWLAWNEDQISNLTEYDRRGVSSGFIRIGHTHNDLDVHNLTTRTSLYGFGNFNQRAFPNTISSVAEGIRTYVVRGMSCTLTKDVLTISAPFRFGNHYGTALALGLDLLVLKDTAGDHHNVHPIEWDSGDERSVRVVYADGTRRGTVVPTPMTLESWLSPTFLSADNTPLIQAYLRPDGAYPHEDSLAVKTSGNVMMASPSIKGGSKTQFAPPALTVVGPTVQEKSLVWGFVEEWGQVSEAGYFKGRDAYFNGTVNADKIESRGGYHALVIGAGVSSPVEVSQSNAGYRVEVTPSGGPAVQTGVDALGPFVHIGKTPSDWTLNNASVDVGYKYVNISNSDFIQIIDNRLMKDAQPVEARFPYVRAGYVVELYASLGFKSSITQHVTLSFRCRALVGDSGYTLPGMPDTPMQIGADETVTQSVFCVLKIPSGSYPHGLRFSPFIFWSGGVAPSFGSSAPATSHFRATLRRISD